MINYQKELNQEQFKVVTRGKGPALVLAGAGSGKTRVITYRVAFLIENGVAEDSILLVTFTNKASREMLSRVELLVGRSVKGLWGGTFHSIALRILKKYSLHTTYEKNFTVLDSDDSRSLIKLCIKEEGVDTSGRRFPAPRVLHSIISYATNADTTIHDVLDLKYPNFFPIADQIIAVARRYQNKKQEANVMDFDDILTNLLVLLETNDALRRKLSQQFEHILVDEYQDTNTIQARIVKALAQTHKNILVVGDDAQSIYSFRAADIQNILQFEKDFPNTEIYRLETNYRSTPNILEVANQVISRNKKQYQKKLHSVIEPHIKPRIVPAQDKIQEAKFIATRVLELRDAGVKLNRIAILFRAAHHSQMLELELNKYDIPYDFRGGLKFFERAHIKDVIAYLRLFHNLNDQVAWYRVLAMQEGVGPATSGKIMEIVRTCDNIEQLQKIKDVKLSAKAKQGWWSLIQTINAMLDATPRTPSELIRSIIKSDQYRDYLETQHTDWRDRIEDLNQLAYFAQKNGDLEGFLAEASLQEGFSSAKSSVNTNTNTNANSNTSQTNTTPDDEPSLILSTIHQAKGLEWDTVFVIHLLSPGFPNERAIKEPSGLEEERRLFYVAITRAQRKLYFTYPMSTGRETTVFEQPSQFLNEIDSELMDQDSNYVRPTTIYNDTADDSYDDNNDNRDNDTIEYISEDQDWRSKSFLKNIDEL